jgi:hypothetical protein
MNVKPVTDNSLKKKKNFYLKDFQHTSGSNMFIESKTTGSRNNFWIIIQKEDDDLEDHVRDY